MGSFPRSVFTTLIAGLQVTNVSRWHRLSAVVYSRHISTARTEDTCSNVAVTFRVADSKTGIHRKYQVNFADLKPWEELSGTLHLGLEEPGPCMRLELLPVTAGSVQRSNTSQEVTNELIISGSGLCTW